MPATDADRLKQGASGDQQTDGTARSGYHVPGQRRRHYALRWAMDNSLQQP